MAKNTKGVRGHAGGTNLLNLKSAEELRTQITLDQERKIQEMYISLAKRVAKAAKNLEGRTNISSVLRQSYLNTLEKQLKEAAEEISRKLEPQIKDAMGTMAEGVVASQREFLEYIGMPYASAAFSHVPKEIIKAITTGSIYGGDWTLSETIWGISNKTSEDIHRVITEGIALNKSTYDIAKDLETYVDPKAKKPWDWNKVYPGTAKKVDYNAQRLARTLVAHAYQQSLINTCAKNPFVTGFKWHSALIHGRTCELCRERDGTVYPKNELPLDHPNGLCTFTATIPYTSDEVVDRLADWVNGKKDSALDEYAQDFMTRMDYSRFIMGRK